MDSRAPLVAINGLLEEKPEGDRLSLPLRQVISPRFAGPYDQLSPSVPASFFVSWPLRLVISLPIRGAL